MYQEMTAAHSVSIPKERHSLRTALIAGANGIFVALALTACIPTPGPTNIDYVSAQTVPSVLSSDEETCGNRLGSDQQDVRAARQNDARELLRRGYSDAEMRARMQEFCAGIIPPQQ